jgi:WD40 repeat protein
VTLLPDDRRAILGGSSPDCHWDVKNLVFLGDPYLKQDELSIKSAVSLYGGKVVACGGTENVVLYTKPGQTPFDMERPKHGATIHCVRADASGKLVLSAGDDGVVKLWKFPEFEASTGILLAPAGAVYSLAESDDGNWVAVGGTNSIVLRQLEGATRRLAWRDTKGRSWGSIFVPMGKSSCPRVKTRRCAAGTLRTAARR